jgi:hypothetical protein
VQSNAYRYEPRDDDESESEFGRKASLKELLESAGMSMVK